MEFLLVSEQEIAARKASGTVGALEWLLLGVRTFMALEMLQSRKGATTGGADMGARLVCLRRWDVPIGGLTIGLALLLLGWSYRWRVQNFAGLGGQLRQGIELTRHGCGSFVDTG